jgi:hypothetical protein
MNPFFTQITKDTWCSPNHLLYPFKEQSTMDTQFFTKSSNVPVERNTMNTQCFDK